MYRYLYFLNVAIRISCDLQKFVSVRPLNLDGLISHKSPEIHISDRENKLAEKCKDYFCFGYSISVIHIC